MTTWQQRVKELKDFEREEGIPLPMFPWQIIEWEDKGYSVDLMTGEILANVTVQPTTSAQAVAYLVSTAVGDFAF